MNPTSPLNESLNLCLIWLRYSDYFQIQRQLLRIVFLKDLVLCKNLVGIWFPDVPPPCSLLGFMHVSMYALHQVHTHRYISRHAFKLLCMHACQHVLQKQTFKYTGMPVSMIMRKHERHIWLPGVASLGALGPQDDPSPTRLPNLACGIMNRIK